MPKFIQKIMPLIEFSVLAVISFGLGYAGLILFAASVADRLPK